MFPALLLKLGRADGRGRRGYDAGLTSLAAASLCLLAAAGAVLLHLELTSTTAAAVTAYLTCLYVYERFTHDKLQGMLG